MNVINGIKKLYFVSDLHLEFFKDESDWARVLPDMDPEGLLVLGGDIIIWRYGAGFKANSPVMRLLAQLSEQFAGVVYIPGNHEYYRGAVGNYFDDKMKRLLNDAGLNNVFLLNNDQLIVNNKLRILGSTLWSNVAHKDPLLESELKRQSGVKSPLNDYNHIRFSDNKREFGRFKPSLARLLHARSYRYLENELAKPFEGKTWVFSHHLPSHRFVQERFMGNRYQSAYASDSDALLEGVELWGMGHSHFCADYIDRIFGTRILLNACGYPMNPVKGFDRNLSVDVPVFELEESQHLDLPSNQPYVSSSSLEF